MFRTALCIKMLMILFTNDTVSISKLAKELDTNPRNIPEFRKELEVAGYPIETVPGRYGGYRLKKHKFFPTVRLTDEEKRAMVESFEYITKRGDLPSMPAYKSAMEKMMSLNNYRSNKDSDMIVIPHYPLAMSKEDIRLRYATVSECINEHTELKIKYRSNQSGIKERIIHPYKLYMYNNAWFVLSYCCSTNKIKYFKLNRILEFSKLNSKFDHVYSYREGSKWHEWLDDYGMIHNGDWYDIKLKFTGIYAAIVQDYKYGRNQTIGYLDEHTTVMTVKMQNKTSITNFVLSFGNNCEVIEPQWLKDEILKKVQEISSIYQEHN